MEKHKIGQKELSAATGIPVNTLGHLIRNESDPNFYNIRKIAFYLKEDLNWIAYGRSLEGIQKSKFKNVEEINKLDADIRLDRIHYGMTELEQGRMNDDFVWFKNNVIDYQSMHELVMRFMKLNPANQNAVDIIITAFLERQSPSDYSTENQAG